MQREGHLEWKVKYAPGKLEAFGKRQGRKLYAKVETTGEPYQVVLTPDKTMIKADAADVCVMNVTVTDSKGREVPTAMNTINFKVQGDIKIIGVGNGNASSHEPDKFFDDNWQRQLFNGKCQVIIQSTGNSTSDNKFTATATGLQPAVVIIKTSTN